MFGKYKFGKKQGNLPNGEKMPQMEEIETLHIALEFFQFRKPN